MSFAMSPGYTKHNAQPPAGSLMGSASACEPMTTYAVERSERSTAARSGMPQTRGGPDLAAAADENEVSRAGRGRPAPRLPLVVLGGSAAGDELDASFLGIAGEPVLAGVGRFSGRQASRRLLFASRK